MVAYSGTPWHMSVFDCIDIPLF